MRMSMRTTSGATVAHAGERLATVTRLADDLDAGVAREDEPEAAAHEPLVVGEDDPDHGPPVSIGSRARTTNPPSRPARASSVPP